VERSSWQKHLRDGTAVRKSLERTRPTRMETVCSAHAYEAREDVAAVEQPVSAGLTYRSGRMDRVTKVASLTLRAYTYAGHAPAKLKARAEEPAPRSSRRTRWCSGSSSPR